jgi:hypothetical protein
MRCKTVRSAKRSEFSVRSSRIEISGFAFNFLILLPDSSTRWREAKPATTTRERRLLCCAGENNASRGSPLAALRRGEQAVGCRIAFPNFNR